MRIVKIREAARTEKMNIDEYLALIYEAREKYPDGSDITIPDYIIPHVRR